MKRVLVRSIYDTFEYVMEHYYPAGLEEMAVRSDTYALISIQDTHTGGFGISFTESLCCKGVLTLYFDDVIRETPDGVLFTEEMAKRIIDFIETHRKTADTLLIHCYAGQSRSRAVGAFAVKMLGGDPAKYFKNGSPNLYVYRLLEDVWSKRKKEDTVV